MIPEHLFRLVILPLWLVVSILSIGEFVKSYAKDSPFVGKPFVIRSAAHWAIKCPEMEPNKSKPHNDPHEIDLTFVGADNSEWKPVKWVKVK